MILIYIQGDWIKEGAIVIDCGINVIPGELLPRLFYAVIATTIKLLAILLNNQ